MPESPGRDNHDKLTAHKLICVAMLALVLAYNAFCHFWPNEFQLGWPADRRELIRSVLYGIAIVLFPFTNLLRHVLLRLNQTMPGPKPAAARYLVTIAVTQGLIEWVGLFGFGMFLIGDGYNTLYIFSLMAALGVYLHRPKAEEYRRIVAELTRKTP
ncbi:hypothetical protein BJL95_12205 [Methylomonas sp. LWB]|uniref:hypothetical protein n=1 Tax=Methylomonas sp. LWB TaxID=1905845 RepID=UPI0008DB04B9|nr:hypothetical protein [Methylomonas sp. LWB]OHX34836.1 hypothetical protein BJL95_12205 [Methylomonas sp. LWB]